VPTDKPSDRGAPVREQVRDLGRLSTHQYERLLELIAPFEKACEDAQGQHTLVDLVPFVPRGDDPLYRVVLLELVKIDLEYRWRHGNTIRLEDYLARFPNLGSVGDLPVPLIHEEYRVRSRYGDRPSLDSYRERFPGQFAELELCVEREPEATLVPATPPPNPLADLKTLLEGQYELQQELGRGGMGVVYRAYDHKHKRLVALKTMRALDPVALYRFKNEFRSLADLSHRNLVQLYEMVTIGEQAFFTMELVAGRNLLAYVRRSPEPTDGHDPAPDAATGRAAGSGTRPVGPPLTADQLTRLRNVIGQLTDAVLTLHEAGKLHRDLKPSNVLVTGEGRVVLLDFGLAAEMDRSGIYQSTDPHILGTVAYMAPEQAASLPLSPATDWYAVGVMLFEALTGVLPFDGRPLEILMNKQVRDAPAPRAVLAEVPEDLSTLVVELLRRDPAARPSGPAILARLGFEPGAVHPPGPSPSLATPFVGRRTHLAFLTEAFQEVQGGHAVTLYVHGRSGAGKSALVQHFLDDVGKDGLAVVLRGRCYEQESVPYKALDSVIDALSRYLARLPTLEAERLLPRDVSALGRVFPVLRRVPAVATAPRRGLDVTDPQELRRRALAALRDMLGRLGDAQHLVIAIDDLQWGDTDSAALLRDLTQPPDEPVMLLLGCYRREDADSSSCLRALLKREDRDHTASWRELAVEPLTEDEGKELALALLTQAGVEARRAEAIARESGGSPFFVYELVQYFQATPDASDPGGSLPGDLTLNEVLWSRVLRLPESLRRLVEVVAVAGRPLRTADACRAAAWEGDERNALTYLRSSRLLRTTIAAESPLIETYHDRIRETVVAHLDAEVRRQHHRRLAEVLEAAGGTLDFEALAAHFRGAGLYPRAAHYFALAAAQAAETLAFDHAARLYRLALELSGDDLDQQERRRLSVRLADALANGGRGSESAREYLAAVVGAEATEARELQRRAAMQLLMSGQVDDGLLVLDRVLNTVGMDLPGGFWRVLLGLGVRRGQLWLRTWLCGLRYREQPESEVSPELLARINVCWAAALGLSMVDHFQGAYFQTRGLLLALKAGEPYHLARALAMEAAHESIGGTGSERRTKELLRATEAIVGKVKQPYLEAMLLLARNTATALLGQWPEAVRLGDEAVKLFRERCTGVAWELGTVHRFTLWPLMFIGDVPEINRRLPGLIKEAQERDDLYGLTNLCLVVRTFVRLAADEPARAREELGQVMDKWSQRGYHVQHMNRTFDEGRIDLYEGKPQAAWERLKAGWPALEKSRLLMVQQVRVFLRHARASCALALVRAGGDARELLPVAECDARALQRENAEWATALGWLLEAGVAMESQDNLCGRSWELLRVAAGLCQKTSMHLYAAAAMRRLGQLLRNREGDGFQAESDRIFAERQVRNPARMTALLVPGFPDKNV
jgi:serine/threonine protein kinase